MPASSDAPTGRRRLVVAAVLVAVVTTVFGACFLNRPWKSYGAWETDDRPAPMICGAPGTSTRRSYELTNPLDPANGARRWELGWTDSKGRRYEAAEVAEDVSRRLQNTEMFTQWPGTQSTVNDVRQRLAPHIITLVSLQPTVVLLQPHDYGGLINRSSVVIVGDRSPDKLCLSGLLNWLFVGTRLTPSDEVWCLVPDLNQEPTHLSLSAAATPIPGTELTITRTADALEIAPTP
jgi:hypothetical protein